MTGGRNYAGEAAEDRAARRRQLLLDAGLQLFGTIGYRKSTVRGLCREARVADRNFYEEFAHTEDLLLAVYHDCLDRLETAVLGAVRSLDDDVETLARVGLEAFFARVEADPRLARVVWFEVLGVSERVDAAYMQRTNRFGDILVGLLDERGILATMGEEERGVVALALVGGVSQVVVNWVTAGFNPPRPRLTGPLARILLAGANVSLDGG